MVKRPELEPRASYQAEAPAAGPRVGRLIFGIVGVAAVAGLGYGVVRGGVEAYEFVDEHQVLVGFGIAGVGYGVYKHGDTLKKKAQQNAHNMGIGLMAAGSVLVLADARSGMDDARAPDDTTSTTMTGETPTEAVVVNESGIVITIPSDVGIPCTDTPPHTVVRGDSVDMIIEGQQGYSDGQMSILYQSVTEIADLRTIYAGQVVDINCRAG